MQAIQEVPRAKGICVGLTLYSGYGEYKQLHQGNHIGAISQ